MILSVSGIIESLNNPNERFDRLQNMDVLNDGNGLPLFTCTATTAEFRVHWNNRNYLLLCPLSVNSELRTRQQLLAARLQQIRSPYLLEYLYFAREMVVFDDNADAHRIDVMLIETPDGSVRLRERMEELCIDRSCRRIEHLLSEFCRMAQWLIGGNVVHGSLNMSHILACADDTLRLTHYTTMFIASPDDPEYERQRDCDNIMVANLALEMKLLAAVPENFRYLRDSQAVINPSRLPAVMQAAVAAGCRPLQHLVEQLMNSNFQLSNRCLLSSILEELGSDTTPVALDLRNHTPSRPTASKDNVNKLRHCIDPRELAENYDWYGPIREGLICVSLNGMWGYIDTAGSTVIALQYEWCNDFDEGRAEVMSDGLYGLIDKSGHEIIPCNYEQVEWNSLPGLAKVSCDGRFGLFDREGNMRLDFTYEWMGSLDNELILVMRDDRYGYLHTDGTVAIPLRYGDAYDFQGDRAMVAIGKRYFTIDREGNEIR